MNPLVLAVAAPILLIKPATHTDPERAQFPCRSIVQKEWMVSTVDLHLAYKMYMAAPPGIETRRCCIQYNAVWQYKQAWQLLHDGKMKDLRKHLGYANYYHGQMPPRVIPYGELEYPIVTGK